jgi:hypothetical protein
MLVASCVTSGPMPSPGEDCNFETHTIPLFDLLPLGQLHLPNTGRDRPTRLARALQELGRLIKSLYLLRFIDDEGYRRRLLIQLNRGQGSHQLASVIFHGKRGELRQRYRDGQEDQLGALGLVVDLVVLWNTITWTPH